MQHTKSGRFVCSVERYRVGVLFPIGVLLFRRSQLNAQFQLGKIHTVERGIKTLKVGTLTENCVAFTKLFTGKNA